MGIDFGIKWNKSLPDSNVTPPTEEEINEVMSKVRRQAQYLKEGYPVSVVGRREVIRAVADGINTNGSGAAAVDLMGDHPGFNARKGIYESTLYVMKDQVALNAYADEI